MSRRTVNELFSEIEDIDRGITAIRKCLYLSTMEKIAIIDEQLEIRNSKYQELQQARALEFKDFISSLDLNSIQIEPNFTEPTKCKLVLLNELSHRLSDSKKLGPWNRMKIGLFSKSADKFDQIKLKQSQRDSAAKKELKSKISEIKKETKKSNPQNIQLFMKEKELEIICKYQCGEGCKE